MHPKDEFSPIGDVTSAPPVEFLKSVQSIDGSEAVVIQKRPERTTHCIRALLLDPTPLTRECLSIGLHSMDPSTEILSAGSPQEATILLQRGEHIDVAICNIGYAGLDQPTGSEIVCSLLEMLGSIPLLVISDQDRFDIILQGFQLGIRGYVTTSLGFGLAMDAIRLVAAGGLFLPGSTLNALMRGQTVSGIPTAGSMLDASFARDGADSPAARLTPREQAVLKSLREGKANKLIARELNMRESTVKAHVGNIMKKLGANNRTQAAFLAFKRK